MTKSIAVIDGQVLSRKNFLDAIDNEIVHLHDTGDIQKVMDVLNGLGAIENVSGHAKAKLLAASIPAARRRKDHRVIAEVVRDDFPHLVRLNRLVIGLTEFIQNLAQDGIELAVAVLRIFQRNALQLEDITTFVPVLRLDLLLKLVPG